MSRLHLTSWQRQRLRRQLAQTPDARVFRRTLAVLEFDFGRPATDIARMLGVARQTVYEWLDTYSETLRATALEDAEGRGRHRLLDEDDEHLLMALLGDSPQNLGYPHTSWTVPLLQHALELGTGRQASDDTIRRFLRRQDYVWKRPRYVLDPDPQLRGKKAADSATDPAPAGAQRRPGPGRDRPLAVPTPACRVVEAR